MINHSRVLRMKAANQTERRNRRSEIPIEALRLYLDALADRQRLRAMALATCDGFLVCGTETDYDLEFLAALGAAQARQVEGSEELVDEMVRWVDLHTEEIAVGEHTLYLASVGAEQPNLGDAPQAIERILGPIIC